MITHLIDCFTENTTADGVDFFNVFYLADENQPEYFTYLVSKSDVLDYMSAEGWGEDETTHEIRGGYPVEITTATDLEETLKFYELQILTAFTIARLNRAGSATKELFN